MNSFFIILVKEYNKQGLNKIIKDKISCNNSKKKKFSYEEDYLNIWNWIN